MKVSKNNIFSPSVITPIIWIFCLSLFLILGQNLPSLTGQFLGAISLWVFLLTFFSMLVQSTKVSDKFDYVPNKIILDIYFVISVCTFPSLLAFAYSAISMGETGHWALDLR
ncbi:MAG: hypothetical protein LBR55_01515, partial [Bacteroidales bacterium]|nr:hypothetical protein [Bacteroidales bacterium]